MSDQIDYDGIKYRAGEKSPLIFNILFLILAVWGGIFMAYYLFGGWSSSGELEQKLKLRETAAKGTGSVSAVAPAKILPEQSRQLFVTNCAPCHGDKGKGQTGPDLTADPLKYGRDRANLLKSIREGRPKGMPSFEGMITAQEMEAVADYVAGLK